MAKKIKSEEKENKEAKELEHFEYICLEIERGAALRNAVKGLMNLKKFYSIIDGNEDKRERYARACEARAESIFEDILEIADESNADVGFNEKMQMVINGEAIQRSKLKIDARKWILSKLNPKKYGERLGMDIEANVKSEIVWVEEKTYEANKKADSSS